MIKRLITASSLFLVARNENGTKPLVYSLIFRRFTAALIFELLSLLFSIKVFRT